MGQPIQWYLLDQVKDRQSFLTFVRALIIDVDDSPPHIPSPEWWKHMTIEQFFSAGLQSAEKTTSKPEPLILKDASWHEFADFLYFCLLGAVKRGEEVSSDDASGSAPVSNGFQMRPSNAVQPTATAYIRQCIIASIRKGLRRG